MKKKTTLVLLIAAGATLAVTSSFATSNKMMRLVSPNLGQSGAPILSITTTTPNNAEVKLDELKVFIGSTCSTIVNIVDFHSTNDDYVTADTEQDKVSSDQLLEMFGPGQGCFKVDTVYRGKTVSTGPIALTWNQRNFQYTAASPNSVTMNY